MKLTICIVSLVVAQALASNAGGLTTRGLDVPVVKFCDLIANPAFYDGKEIRVDGVYSVAGTDNSTFFSSSCSDGNTVWVEFDPNYQSCSTPKVVKSLAIMRRKSGWRWARPHVSVITVRFRSADVQFIGKFTASNPYRKPDSPETDGPFGPIRSNRERSDFVFNVLCVRRVKPLSRDAKY